MVFVIAMYASIMYNVIKTGLLLTANIFQTNTIRHFIFQIPCVHVFTPLCTYFESGGVKKYWILLYGA